MKSKKHLGLVSAVMGVCLAVTSFTAVTAFADDTQTTDTNVYTVKTENYDRVYFANPIDYFTATDSEGKEIDFDASKITGIKVFQNGNEVDAENYVYDTSAKTIYFKSTGDFTLKVSFAGQTDKEVPVKVLGDGEATLSYKKGIDVAGFEEAIQKQIDALDKDTTEYAIPTSFKEGEDPVPVFWDFIESNVYSKEHLVAKVYSATGSGSFSAVSSSWDDDLAKIKLNSSATYFFYVEVQDPDGNTIAKESEYIQKIDGWYDGKETEDESDDELIIPIFRFDYVKDSSLNLEISGGGSKGVKGIVGQQYTSIKVTTNATQNDVVLWYRANESAEWAKAVAGTDAKFGKLTTSSTSFTPLKKGQFKITVSAKGGEDGFEAKSVESEIVTVSKVLKQQKLVNDKFVKFLKNNLLSVIFLGIALLCLVGIIVLAFYKPSDDETPKAKKGSVEDKKEVTDADETSDVEDAEEDTETEETEEVTEEAIETETTEETDEATETAEEVPAPAEEVAPVEETPVVETAPVEETPAPADGNPTSTDEEPKND